MSSLVDTSWSCRSFIRFCDAYLDGELEASGVLGAEVHVAECETCRDQANLGRAMRESVRRIAKSDAQQHAKAELGEAAANDPFRQRVIAAMVAEQARCEARDPRAPHDGRESYGAPLFAMPNSLRDAVKLRRPSWRTMSVAVAGAAAIAVVFSAPPKSLIGRQLVGAKRAMQAMRSTNVRAAAIGSELVADLIAQHARPLPPERTDPREVRELEQYVGVPVLPARFQRGGARFVGGRVLTLHQERAAMLQYEIGSGTEARRVSVFVYDPRRIQIDEAELTPRGGEAEGATKMRVGHAQGYALAVTESEGVGYALATDMDPENSTQFAAFVQ